MWVQIPRGANYFGSGIRKLFSTACTVMVSGTVGRLEVWAVGGLGGWRFGRLAFWAVGVLGGWRFGRLAVCAVGDLRGWRFARLAVWADMGRCNWRFARLAVCAVCAIGGCWTAVWAVGGLGGWQLMVADFAVCVWRFAFGSFCLVVCVWRFAFGGLRPYLYLIDIVSISYPYFIDILSTHYRYLISIPYLYFIDS